MSQYEPVVINKLFGSDELDEDEHEVDEHQSDVCHRVSGPAS